MNMNIEEARAAVAKIDSLVENARLTCVYAINDYEHINRDKLTDEEIEYYKGRKSLAYDILGDLGYNADHFFMGTIITEAVK